MEITIFTLIIIVLIVVAAAHSTVDSTEESSEGAGSHPTQKSRIFQIEFPKGRTASAMRADPDADPQEIVELFALETPRPVIFITGGASRMTPYDIEITRDIMDKGVAAFAARHNVTIVDGGTEAGVMQMIGESRKANGYTFPLIGVAPYHKVTYPGSEIKEWEAELEDGHSHFVLVNSDEWGGESGTIVNLTRAIAGNNSPTIGILINGGKIAERDVYLAVTSGDHPIPILVLDGSGRTADNISSAYKTQQTDSALIKAIIQGGDIRLTPLDQGAPALIEHLTEHFGLVTDK